MSFGVSRVPFRVPRVDLGEERGLVRSTVWQALPTQMAACDRRPGAPTAGLGGRMEVSLSGEAWRLKGLTGCVQRRLGVGMAMIHHPTAFLRLGLRLVNECWYEGGPVNFGVLSSHELAKYLHFA